MPPGGTLSVRAELTYTGDAQDLDLKTGMLRVTGNQDWEINGRSSLPVTASSYEESVRSRTGWAVAVQKRSAVDGGDLVVVGARLDDVGNAVRTGTVDVYEGGRFVTRLKNPSGRSFDSFGEVVAVGGGVIVVGAPEHSYLISVPEHPTEPRDQATFTDGSHDTLTTLPAHYHINKFGAAYVFEKNAAGVWTQQAKLTVGFPTAPSGCTAITKWARTSTRLRYLELNAGPERFGSGVSISDDGNTIVATKDPTSWTCTNANQNSYAASAHVFTKPASGWADANTGQTAVRPLWYVKPTGSGAFNPYGDFTVGTAPGNVQDYDQTQRGHIKGDVAISGDGSTIAVAGLTFPRLNNGFDTDTVQWRRLRGNRGMVLVFEKPTGGWNDTPGALLQQDALLIVAGTQKAQIGKKLAISDNGGVIVSTGSGEYWDQTRLLQRKPNGEFFDGGIHNHTNFSGQAYVWSRSGAAWDNAATETARLYSTTAVPGDLYGNAVAVSDDGLTIAVAHAYKAAVAAVEEEDPTDPLDEGSASTYAYGEAHIFKVNSVSDWADDSTPDITLTSPERAQRLFYGRGLAIDGSTLVVGQSESFSNILTGHGRTYTYDLSASNLQDSARLLDDCTSSTLDRETTWTCAVGTVGGTEITIPPGTTGSFVISATLKLDNDDNPDITLTDTLTVKVGTVNEAASATFEIAKYRPDPVKSATEDYKDTIAATGKHRFTRMQLSILNENGLASGAGSVSALFFTTNAGTLTLVSPTGAAMANSCNGLTCQVDVSKLNSDNSDKITVQLAHPGPGKSGTATVRAQVLPTVGGMQLATEPVTITFAGEPDRIAISEPATGVLSSDTNPGTTQAADDTETRDRLRLSVSAQDKSGNKTDTPTDNPRITITGPDGKPVSPTGIVATFPRTGPDGDDDGEPDVVLDADGNPQIEIDVDAPPTDKLKTGEYTITLRTGGKTASQTFTVSGGAANIAVGEPDGDLTVNGRFTLTATVTDAGGAAVPDGTPVTFADNPTAATPVLVNLSKGTTTEDGQASATYLVISAGRGYVTVTSGTASTATLVATGAAVTTPTEPTNPADSLSTRRVNAFSTWTGTGTTTASALLTDLDNGIDTILLWSNGAWLRYGISDGRKIPGSMDFEVRRGAILWLGNGNGG